MFEYCYLDKVGTLKRLLNFIQIQLGHWKGYSLLFWYSWDTGRVIHYYLGTVGTIKGYSILFGYSWDNERVIHGLLDTVETIVKLGLSKGLIQSDLLHN